MAGAPTIQAALQGRRILVAEDEYMIAEEIAEILGEAGAEVLGPVPSISHAMHLITAEDRISGALLDLNLGKEVIWPVVDMLLARGVPLVLATGYDASAIPPTYLHLPRCEKPASGQALTRALAQALTPGLPDQRLNTRPVSVNTVHFAIWMATLKSMRVIGCGARGRSG